MAGHTDNSDDWSDGRLNEHKALREAQILIFARLCNINCIKQPLLQMIVQQFENLEPNSSNPTQAEVPLTLMTTLA